MQVKLRKFVVLAGFSAAILFTLLIISFPTGWQILGIVTAALGLIWLVLGCFLAFRLLGRVSEILSRLSTRIKNVEVSKAKQESDIGVRFGRFDGDELNTTDELSSVVAALEYVDDSIEALRGRLDFAEKNQTGTARQLLGAHKQLKVLRNRVPAGFMNDINTEIVALRKNTQALLRTTFESAVHLNRAPISVLTLDQSRALFEDYLSHNELLQLQPLIENFDPLQEQSLSTLRRLYRFYRNSGYWDLASLVIREIYEKSGLESDSFAAVKLKHEIEVFARPDQVTAELQEGPGHDPAGPILHMVGRVLPETQTGYTLRTQYTALAQARKKLPVAIVGQSGITQNESDDAISYEYQGIDYYLLPGPARNEVLLDDWLRCNIEQLARLVLDLKPSILHGQSDFFNSLIVSAVGKKYGIPTVYESRGFWEDSWLSRTIDANGWDDSETLFGMYGLPSAYKYRKHAEEVARILPDHVFTLAEVMKDHILDSAEGEIDPDAVSIVPNAVESENFPVQARDPELAAEIGIPEEAVTVGYISSMVEYEGIDTLIDAFQLARKTSTPQMCLLLVGDGDYLPKLKQRVDAEEVSNVYFTGRVPHEDILRYYGLIDLFVVPRKPSAVADLVTPLKPFEAFSTGRAVVLSDVGALREIAEQSGVVELFRAGDAHHLAQKLNSLVQDHQRRHALSQSAARWVRNHRSWDRNVNEYYRIYRKLGYAGPSNLLIEAELSLTNRGLNPGELLESLEGANIPSLVGWFTIQDEQQSAASILEDGWHYANFQPVKVDSIKDWASYGAEDRSWGFHLHAWEFMDPLIRQYDESGELKWLEDAIRIALKWIKTQRTLGDRKDPMAWYDMSLALRTPRLIALLLRVARAQDARDETLILAAELGDHFDQLRRDHSFNPNNNHGFYTAVSQIHAAKYAPMYNEAVSARAEGRDRLASMAKSQFATDGTHLEHSPDYHRMLLNSFERALSDGLIEDEGIKDRVRRAAHALGWMVQPDGALVQFGDTPEKRVVNANAESSDPEARYILSDGLHGQEPASEMAVYSEGGYAFVRSPQPDRPGVLYRSSYLALSAAFHSRTHKHADDLNLVWYDQGQQILADSGRFGYGELLPADSPLRTEGYYYASPERQYIEGTVAHNTLMMDGRDQERRNRKPYGSGIGKCFESEGVFDLTGRVQHQDYIHRRRVIFRPGIDLILRDSVFSQSPERREATLWLNIAGHFEIERTEEGVVFVSKVNEEYTRVRIEGPGRMLEPVRGQTTPLRGWRSRSDRDLEPTWSLGFSFPIETRASVETRFTFLD